MAKAAEIDDSDVTELPEKDPVATADGSGISQKDAASDIEDILGGVLEDDPQDHETDDEEEAEPDPLAPDAEDVEEDDEPETDGPSKPGQYVSPKAKFKLADGTEITVGDLARNNLYQRDYSQKTDELAREREAFASEKAETSQLRKTLSDEREFIIWFAERHVPKPPQPPTDLSDPMAEIEYGRQLRSYNEMVEAWRQFKWQQQQDGERSTGETQKQATARELKQANMLVEKLPFLKDNGKARAFFDTLVQEGSKHYGLTQDEILGAAKQDHRYVLALRDALSYRRAKEKAPAVQKELAKKPVALRGSAQRGAQQQMANQSRRETTKRLRETGSMRDGIAAIEALIS